MDDRVVGLEPQVPSRHLRNGDITQRGLEVGLIADRHYVNGNMHLFEEWVRVGKRLDELLPWTGATE
jgi:hypothetical protein